MKDSKKTKAQLIDELAALRHRASQLDEHRYRAIVEDQTELICRWLPGGVHNFVNSAYCRCFGMTAEELLGQSLMDLIPQEDHDKVLRHFASLCPQHPVANHEHRVIATGGEIRWHQWTDRAIIDAGGGIVEYQSVGRDITEQKLAENALRESEERLRTVVNASKDAMIAAGDDGLVTLFNPAAERMFGQKASSMIGQQLGCLMPEDHRARHQQYVEGFFRTGQPRRAIGQTVELPAVTSDGRVFPMELSLSVGHHGQERFVLAVIRDITERKQAEEALHRSHQEMEHRVRDRTADLTTANQRLQQEIAEHKRTETALHDSEQLLRQVIDASPTCVFVKGQDGRFLLANKRMADSHGTTPEAMVGKMDADFVGSSISSIEEVERFLADDREVIRSRRPMLIADESFTLPDGTVRWHQTTKIPLSVRGNPNCVLGVAVDITDRKQAEEALRYRGEFEALITSVSTRFINLEIDAIDEGISQDLRKIGEFVGVDRSYVFEFSDNRTRMSNTYEWCAPGIATAGDRLQNLPLSGFPWFVERIQRLETVHVPRVEDLPADASSEKKEWQAEDIQSLICVPMVCGRELLGFVGFDSVGTRQTWSDETIALLRITGEIFANALARKRAQQALQASERKYRSLVENIPECAWTANHLGRTTFISPNIERICGYTPLDIYEAGARLSMGRIHPEDAERVQQAFDALFAERRKFDVEYRMRRKDGKWIWVHDRATATHEENGLLCADGVVSDVTARKEAAEALREREEALRDLFENANDFILSVTPDGRLAYANRAWRESLGYSEEEVAGLSLFDIVHADSQEHCEATFRAALEGGPASNTEAVFVAKDGRSITVEGNCNCRFKDGRPAAIRGIFRDVTERGQAEQALRESQRTLSTLMSNLPGMAYRCRNDQDWTMEFVSDGCFDLTGYQPADLTNNAKVSYAELIHEDDQQSVWNDVQAALVEGRPFRLLYRIITAQGQQKWVWEQGRGVFSEVGELLGLEGFINDITERKQAEEALSESRQMLQLVLDTIPTRVFWKDRNSVYIGCNRVFAKDAGLGSAQEIVGKTDYDLAWKREETDFYRECDRRVMCSDMPEYHITEPQLRAAGEEAWLDTHKIPMHDADGKVVGILGTYEDITERKQAEEALRDSEQRFRALVETTSDWVWETDQDGRYTYASPKVTDLFGYTPEEVLGKTPFDLMLKDRRNRVAESFRRMAQFKKPITSVENTIVRKDGQEIVVETSGVPILDAAGNLVGYRGIDRDITARKRAEEALRRSERLAALGTTVAGVAHELNNPLTSICGLSQLLAKEPSVGVKATSMAEEIARQGHLCGMIVENLLGFARERPVTRTRVAVNVVMDNCLRLTSHDPRLENVEIRTDLDQTLPGIMADPYQLEQVFINIVTNARDAVQDGGDPKRIDIRTSCDGREVCVEVRDTGPGLADPSKVFDPFYTTKSAGAGTGLGLSLSYGIVEEHHGRISARNTEQGACFEVRLPIDPPAASGAAASRRRDPAAAGRGSAEHD